MLNVVDAGDANIVPSWIDRAHAMIFHKVLEVAGSGAIPIVLGGDHSITWPSASAVAQVRHPARIGIVHFDAHADTGTDDWGVLAGHGTPMRRLIESGAVRGRELRPGRPARLLAPARRLRLDARTGHALAPHDRDRGARRGSGRGRCHRRGARWPRRDLPVARHRRHRSRHGAGHRHAGTGRHAHARGAPRRPPGRRSGQARGHGRRRGLAAVRPVGDHGDGGEPGGPRSDERTRREEAARARRSGSRARPAEQARREGRARAAAARRA